MEDRGASHGSLRALFLHVLEADGHRFDFLLANRTGAWKDLDDTIPSFQGVHDLRVRADALGARVSAVRDGWRGPELRRTVELPTHSRILALSLKAVALPMLEEGLQHRGEVNAMLWQMGTVASPLGFDDGWLSHRPPSGDAGPRTAKD